MGSGHPAEEPDNRKLPDRLNQIQVCSLIVNLSRLIVELFKIGTHH